MFTQTALVGAKEDGGSLENQTVDDICLNTQLVSRNPWNQVIAVYYKTQNS